MKFGLLLYPGVEPIDLATVGVLSMARRVLTQIEYLTVANKAETVPMSNGLRVMADVSFADAPQLDVIIVPGGPGWVKACDDKTILDYLSRTAEHAKIVSVCTGAMILAAAGLLENRRATTKREIVAGEERPLDVLARRVSIEAVEARIVDDGDIITGGGVSLGHDLTLYLIERFVGEAAARETARILEYGRAYAANGAEMTDIGV